VKQLLCGELATFSELAGCVARTQRQPAIFVKRLYTGVIRLVGIAP
jgi:hypothetical protein